MRPEHAPAPHSPMTRARRLLARAVAAARPLDPNPVRSLAAGCAALLGVLLAIVPLSAQPITPVTGGTTPQDSKPPVHAQRCDSPINVDAVLDEAIWKNAEFSESFHQKDPDEWAAPSQRTAVAVLFDADAIYIGAHLYDTAPDSVIARLTRRDVDIQADRFYVYIDPNRDRRSGWYFGVNAAGTLYDGTISNDGNLDNSWDGVWTGRARRTPEGWDVEMRIPLSQMRFAGGAAPEWGINFYRMLQRRNETIYMTHQPKNAAGFVSRFVALDGLQDMHSSRTIEFMPYVTGKGEFTAHAASDPTISGAARKTGDVGGDLRMSVGSRLTLNATINPDFGQVEVDPAVVNLSDAETYFSEKRPFFTEGASNFRFGNEGANSYWNFNWPEPQFFYSRRIGRGPQVQAPDADYIDEPLGTTILGAAKLTGRLGRSWNFGTLHALTGREEAKLYNAGAQTAKSPVEPLTYYGFTRALHEFKDRRYGLGFMGSSVIRKLDDPALESSLNSEAFVSGMDGWFFLDEKKKWVVSGWTAMSHVRGSEEAIGALQQSPRHYFQRPDAPQVKYDPTATSMTGFGSRLWLNKQSGDVYLNAGLGTITPGFDVNDVGFLRGTDVVNSHFAIGKRWTKPTSWRKQQNVHGALFGSWDYHGDMTWGGGFLEGSTEFVNNYSWNYETAYNPKHMSDRATRGGPQMEIGRGYEYSMYFDTDGKRPLFYAINGYTYFQPDNDSYYWEVDPSVEIKPISNLGVSVGPFYSRNKDTAAYIDVVDDPLATTTFGRRYLFAYLDQTTLGANIRLNWAFSPRVSLQFFGQPFFTTADYSRYREFSRPRSFDFLEYGTNGSTWDPMTFVADPDGAGPAPAIPIGDRNFNFRSMRGNAVLRWEYMPGSTFYLVWTQLRQDVEETGDFALKRSATALFDAHPDNIFLAKLTYYFTP